LYFSSYFTENAELFYFTGQSVTAVQGSNTSAQCGEKEVLSVVVQVVRVVDTGHDRVSNFCGAFFSRMGKGRNA